MLNWVQHLLELTGILRFSTIDGFRIATADLIRPMFQETLNTEINSVPDKFKVTNPPCLRRAFLSQKLVGCKKGKTSYLKIVFGFRFQLLRYCSHAEFRVTNLIAFGISPAEKASYLKVCFVFEVSEQSSPLSSACIPLAKARRMQERENELLEGVF
jgi:hypothetical protein